MLLVEAPRFLIESWSCRVLSAPHPSLAQAGAILRAEVYGIPRPEWATNPAQARMCTLPGVYVVLSLT